VTDGVNTSSNVGNVQPATEPGGTPASGWAPNAMPVAFPGPGTGSGLSLSKTGRLHNDVDGDLQADPGDTLLYEIAVANAGHGVTALNVFVDDCVHPGLVVGALGPAALPDVYDWIGNVTLNVGAANGLRSNDFDIDGVTAVGDLVVTADAGKATDAGGTVNIQSNGAFSYMPPAGLIGLDSFEYTVSDDDGLVGTGVAQVNLRDRVWFVDNTGSDEDTRRADLSRPRPAGACLRSIPIRSLQHDGSFSKQPPATDPIAEPIHRWDQAHIDHYGPQSDSVSIAARFAALMSAKAATWATTAARSPAGMACQGRPQALRQRVRGGCLGPVLCARRCTRRCTTARDCRFSRGFCMLAADF
jgi:uncharacterized repeat protein (TIGR01451 family)